MTTFNPPTIDWDKINGLLPAIIQDNQSGQVLMLGYMNQAALDATCATGRVTFYSRTKKRLWMKGETSGNILNVVQFLIDCDADALLVLAEINGPCCHLDQPSCFGHYSAAFTALSYLEALIYSRFKFKPKGHYTTQLFEQGLKRIAQKVGEEGVEVALAAVCGDENETINEAADLLYHLIVLLVAKQISLSEVNTVLEQRQITGQVL